MNDQGGNLSVDLHRVRNRVLARLVALESRLVASSGDDAAWREYLPALDILLRVEDRLSVQEDGRVVLTTKEMAERLGISINTLLRRKKKGVIRPSVAHGKALGWRLQDALH